MATTSNQTKRSSPRKLSYGEQVIQVMRVICAERGLNADALTWQSEDWETVQGDAVAWLYVQGRYQVAPF